MPDGEVCESNSDCTSNKCLGGFCCSQNMDYPNCNACNSFLFNKSTEIWLINIPFGLFSILGLIGFLKLYRKS